MAEQVNLNQNNKVERSSANQVCRLSYDTLMSASKNFIYNFSFLTDEEKGEYKSLGNHVKQLNKCMESIKKNVSNVKRSSSGKIADLLDLDKEDVVKDVVKEVVKAVSNSKSRSNKKSNKAKELSPTAELVASVTNDQNEPSEPSEPPKQSEQKEKKSRSKKTEVVPDVVPEVLTEVSEPIVENDSSKKSAPKKTNQNKSK
jgi:hypothetical protein